ncbi:MAG TPA: hypothetical protein VGS22_06515 [Thermoanaerobaculia bacterium]|jgi:hypothetical protein|nr:hypothetical protein [Thermoanaerobaculia bacterium]
MRKIRGARRALRILACALIAVPFGLIGAAGQSSPPAAVPSASPSASPSKGAPIFVTMPKNEAAAKHKASPSPESMTVAINREMRARNTPVAIGILTAVVALIFVVVVLLALRRRAKVCPRCFSLLYELGDRDDAGEDLPEEEPRDSRPVLACLGCGEVGMLRAGLFFRSGGQCPKCHRWNLASRFKVVHPSTYMMFGLIRIEEACACGYEARFLRSTPPNQAPIPEFVGASPFRS